MYHTTAPFPQTGPHEPRFFLIPGLHNSLSPSLSLPLSLSLSLPPLSLLGAHETSSYTLFHPSGLAFSDISTLFPF